MNYTYYRRYKTKAKKSSNFKSFFWLVIGLVLVLLLLRACISLTTTFLEEKKDEATLTVNEGTATVLEWGQKEYGPASDAQLLLVGDTVSTGAGSLVTLRFAGEMEVHLDSDTRLVFESAEVGEKEIVVNLELLEGRAWVDQSSESQSVTLNLSTRMMDFSSHYGSFLIANQSTKQYAYSFDGEFSLNYVDRNQGESVIETLLVKKGQKSILTKEAEVALLARENLTLVGEAGDDFIGDRFVQWNLGSVESISESIETAEASSLEEVAVVEETPELEVPATAAETEPIASEIPIPTLCVAVTSPGLSVSIQKSAIAIEGSITCGTASTVTVTWAGNGKPYVLGGFAPGDSSFRYVADASYGNLKAGSNTYTIVATAADGTVSKTVTVTINAEF